MRSRPWIVLLAAVAFQACGEDQTLSAGSADDLRGQVAAVREAAGNGDRDAALEALDGLEADVKDLEAGGSLAEADADALRRGIGRARRRVRAEVTEPTPEPTPAPTATPEPTPTPVPTEPEDDGGEEGGEPGTGNDEQKGKGETQGKGQGKKDKGKEGKD
jgi:hypothetical protein